MDFQDRFRDRSSLLTKNGLLTILNAPGNPISKSNTNHISRPFISAGNPSLFQSDLQLKKPSSGISSQSSVNNSGLSTSTRPSNSRQGFMGVQSNRVSPQNVFLLTKRSGIVRTPSTRESSRGVPMRRYIQEVPNLKAVGGENNSFLWETKYNRQKNRSVDTVRRGREMDFVLEDHISQIDKSYREISREGKENIREWDPNMIKNAIDSVERLQMKGASREGGNNVINVKEIEENEDRSPVRVRIPLILSGNLERNPLSNVLPKLEKVQNMNVDFTRSILGSFRERDSQAAGHLKRYIRKINGELEEERRPMKSKSLEKLVVLKDKDELENFKVEFIRNKGEKKERSATGGRLRMPGEKDKAILAETERIIKKVSFKEEAEIMTVRGNTRQKESRRLKFDRGMERFEREGGTRIYEKDREDFF